MESSGDVGQPGGSETEQKGTVRILGCHLPTSSGVLGPVRLTCWDSRGSGVHLPAPLLVAEKPFAATILIFIYGEVFF